MFGTIPLIRVNYTIGQLVKAAFVSEQSHHYRSQLMKLLGEYFSTQSVLLTSSCRSAIYQIVRSLPQHKVVVPAYTCEVVIEAVRLANKEVVFADVDKSSMNIKNYPELDSDTIVIATHQYGILSEIKALVDECKAKGAVLIEDCAGSLGGRIDGQLTGTFGQYGIFSFSASKTLHSPTKGGFIIAQNPEDLFVIKPLSDLATDHGKFRLKQLAKGVGFCLAKCRWLSSILFRFSKTNHQIATSPNNDYSYHHEFYEWQAHVVLNQMVALEKLLNERKALFKKYDESLNNSKITKPMLQNDGVCIRYPILVSNRDEFIEQCKRQNISVGTGYNRLYCPDTYENAHAISKEIVYLPFGNGFSKKEIERVISVINSIQ